jgi:hypothetical protein
MARERGEKDPGTGVACGAGGACRLSARPADQAIGFDVIGESWSAISPKGRVLYRRCALDGPTQRELRS